MKGRKTILKELLFYFCDLCEENAIEYSFIGEPALEALKNNSLPPNYNRLTIAIPYGQIQRLIPLVNDDPESPYKLRYLLNHPTSFVFELMDPSFMMVRFKKENRTVIQPAFLTIIELEKDVPKKIRKRFDNKLLFVNSRKWNLSEPKTCLRKIKWKAVSRVKGKDRFLRELLDEREEAMGLADWNDVCGQEIVVLRKNKIPGELLEEVQTINLEGHTIHIAPVLTDLDYTKDCFFNIKKTARFQMDLGPIPPEFLEDPVIREQMDTILEEFDTYSALTQSVIPETEIISHMWDTYKMTVDVKRFEDDFDQALINEITERLDDNDLDTAKELLKPYTKAKKKYEKKEVQFIENQKIEPLVARYQQLKDELS